MITDSVARDGDIECVSEKNIFTFYLPFFLLSIIYNAAKCIFEGAFDMFSR